jgi:RNase P protein component
MLKFKRIRKKSLRNKFQRKLQEVMEQAEAQKAKIKEIVIAVS